MVKTKIIETTEKYDRDGKLIEKITREETTEDNKDCLPFYSYPGDKSCAPNADFMLSLDPNELHGCVIKAVERHCGKPEFEIDSDGGVNITADSVTINQQPA